MRGLRQFTGLLLAAAVGVAGLVARADVTQNLAVSGDTASLAAAGFGNLNGAGISVGIVEADGGLAAAYYGNLAANGIAPNSSLPNGNQDLPGANINFVQTATLNLPGGQLPQGNPPAAIGPGFAVGNHASEVTGVVMGQGMAGPADRGIATASHVQFAALNPNAANIDQDAATQIQLVLQQRDTPVVNMSWGFRQGTVAAPTNNGSSPTSQFVDWAATRYDALMVVAGNEGAPGSSTDLGAPSDSYNSINVAATGARGSYSNGVFVINNASGAVLNYGVAAGYNTSNLTADKSPITGYGREKTDIVAPGGDPATTGLNGTFGSPPGFDNLFQSTAGGQYTFSFSVSGTLTGGTSTVPFYSNDVFNGTNPPLAGGNVTTNSAFTGSNISQALPDGPPAPVFPATNPGGFANTDLVSADSIAGTSFAAPLVSGASALLYQYGGNQGFSTDHRVIKAILLNGATHTYYDPNLGRNLALTQSNGVTPWTRLPGAGMTPLLVNPPVTAAQFGGSPPLVRPGLDPQLGTGLLNVTNSLINYAAGRQAPGLVNPIGWDLEPVPMGGAANTIFDAYTINIPVAGLFKSTLCWDDPVTINNAGENNTYSPGNSTFTRGELTELDLYLFQVLPNGSLGQNIDYSTSDIDNVQYLYDNLQPGTYQIDVANGNMVVPQDTTYGLAWSVTPVPEPAALALLATGAAIGMCTGWRRRRRS